MIYVKWDLKGRLTWTASSGTRAQRRLLIHYTAPRRWLPRGASSRSGGRLWQVNRVSLHQDATAGCNGLAQGGNGLAQVGNGLAQGGSGLAQGRNNLAQGGNGLAQGGNGLAQGRNGLTQGGNGLAQVGNGLAQGGNGLAQGRNGLAQGGNGLAQGGNGLAQGRNGSAQGGNGLAQDGTGLAQGEDGLAQGGNGGSRPSKPQGTRSLPVCVCPRKRARYGEGTEARAYGCHACHASAPPLPGQRGVSEAQVELYKGQSFDFQHINFSILQWF